MKLGRQKAPQGRQRLRSSANDNPQLSYHASRRDEQETRTGRQMRSPTKGAASKILRFWLQRTGLLILLLLVAFVLINIVALSTNVHIVTVTSSSSGYFLRQPSAYQAEADKILGSSVWNRNKITIDTAHISNQMKAAFPELSKVSVTVPLFSHRPTMYIQPAEPAVVLSADNGSFVLDTNGKALLASSQLPSANKLPQVADQSGLHVELNRQVLTSDDVRFIQTVIAELAAKHITVSAMSLPAASKELDVHIAGQPYYVKFNLQNHDARQQAGTYLATLTQLQRQHATPSQYIDVRVDGRAYYQ